MPRRIPVSLALLCLSASWGSVAGGDGAPLAARASVRKQVKTLREQVAALIPFPESADLGTGVYLRPTVVAHPGEGILEICNATGVQVDIPFGTFFQLRLIG